MTWFVLLLTAFFLGSLPFSLWLGNIFLKKDVRQIGDGNPGATNVFKSGGKLIGILALLLDITKAALPVGVAYHNLGLRGTPMFLIAVAPVLGHVFSPFLRFKGGKGLASVLGVWIGLTIWKASLAAVLGVIIGIALTSIPGWAVVPGLIGILMTLLVWMPDPIFLLTWAAITLILAWTHRADLRQRPKFRSWLVKLFESTRK